MKQKVARQSEAGESRADDGDVVRRAWFAAHLSILTWGKETATEWCSMGVPNATGRDYDERYFRVGLRLSF
jgi:hypothetical protein